MAPALHFLAGLGITAPVHLGLLRDAQQGAQQLDISFGVAEKPADGGGVGDAVGEGSF
jgi:hypothetical protein